MRTGLSIRLVNGSKSFLINLKVTGGILEHECYFTPGRPPNTNQTGKRWAVSGTLLAIARAGLDECDGLSLIAIFDGFENT